MCSGPDRVPSFAPEVSSATRGIMKIVSTFVISFLYVFVAHPNPTTRLRKEANYLDV